jgi:Ala-tRNA(Pro) deacylase
MAATPDDRFAHLDRLGIDHATVSHEPLFTVEQRRRCTAIRPGTTGSRFSVRP